MATKSAKRGRKKKKQEEKKLQQNKKKGEKVQARHNHDGQTGTGGRLRGKPGLGKKDWSLKQGGIRNWLDGNFQKQKTPQKDLNWGKKIRSQSRKAASVPPPEPEEKKRRKRRKTGEVPAETTSSLYSSNPQQQIRRKKEKKGKRHSVAGQSSSGTRGLV